MCYILRLSFQEKLKHESFQQIYEKVVTRQSLLAVTVIMTLVCWEQRRKPCDDVVEAQSLQMEKVRQQKDEDHSLLPLSF